jgi:hypothetical protein
MANTRTGSRSKATHELDPETGLATEWIEGTIKAIEDVTSREAQASRDPCNGIFASCLYNHFLSAMRAAQKAAMGSTRN